MEPPRHQRSGRRPASSWHALPAWDVDLRTCPSCLSRLVQLVGESECDEGCAMIERRCPECGFRDIDHVDAASAQLFREHQDAARGELVALLGALGYD